MYKMERDAYYIKIVISKKENDLYRLSFIPFYVNEAGINEKTFNTKIFYIESEDSEYIQDIMENIIDFLYIESKNDDIFRYSKLKFGHKSIMLLRSHSTLIGCHSAIVELISIFLTNKIMNKKELREEII